MTQQERDSQTSRRSRLIILILALTTGGILYRLIVLGRLEQTSALFIGIPAVLALLLAMSPSPSTVRGGIMKGLTFALLLSGPVLGEGFLCVLFSAPLFYLVGLLVAFIIDRRKRKKDKLSTFALIAILAPMSFEGVSPTLSFNREETVQVTKILTATPQEVLGALSLSPRIGLPLPLFLRPGFPLPTLATGEGLEIGATRTIHFASGEGEPGDLQMRVEESDSGFVRFVKVSDQSKIAHWLDWKTSEVEWVQLNDRQTQVTWTLRYERRLDPAWYFGPWERYATRLAAEYLIQANATPSTMLQQE